MGMGTLDAYREDFEEPLCASTREYYARKAQEWIQIDTTSAYLEKAERAIEAEKRRVTEYLLSETETPLLVNAHILASLFGSTKAHEAHLPDLASFL